MRRTHDLDPGSYRFGMFSRPLRTRWSGACMWGGVGAMLRGPFAAPVRGAGVFGKVGACADCFLLFHGQKMEGSCHLLALGRRQGDWPQSTLKTGQNDKHRAYAALAIGDGETLQTLL